MPRKSNYFVSSPRCLSFSGRWLRVVPLFSLAAVLWLQACSDSTAPVNTSCDVFVSLTLSVAGNGTLANSDCKRAGNENLDVWRLVLAEVTTVQFDLTSGAFDAFLLVRDSDGTILDSDDDGGPGLNSSLTIELDPGTYDILASSFEAGETGVYQILATVITD